MIVRYLLSFCIMAFSSYSFATTDSDTNKLLEKTRSAQKQQQQHQQYREAEFAKNEQALRQLRNKLQERKRALQTDIANLNERFKAQERKIAEQEKALHLQSGSLGELFGVVRQVAKSFQREQADSITDIGASKYMASVEAIAAAETLPNSQLLFGLWRAFLQQLEYGAKVTTVEIPYHVADGTITQKQVVRLGAFGLVDDNGYLIWSGKNRAVRPYSEQPPYAPSARLLQTDQAFITLDPSKGALLEQLSLTPTLGQRLEQGGAIGKVILGLLGSGLLIGLIQGSFLLRSRLQIQAQLKDSSVISDNALGRVLSVYKQDQSANVEALELRLYETVMDEQRKLDRGLPLLKLFAALAPMLGLLGTVTGMIETFQVITQFGNADPRMMASGISTALITTVLGLMAAMPLLFIHNVLSAQAENVRALLEKQGIGMVAERAEQGNA